MEFIISLTYQLCDKSEYRRHLDIHETSEEWCESFQPISVKGISRNKQIFLTYKETDSFKIIIQRLENKLLKSGLTGYELKVVNSNGELVFENSKVPVELDPEYLEVLYFTPMVNGPGWLMIFNGKSENGFYAELLDYKGYGIPEVQKIIEIMKNSWPGFNYEKFGFFLSGGSITSTFYIRTGIVLTKQDYIVPTFRVVHYLNEEGARPEFTVVNKKEIERCKRRRELLQGDLEAIKDGVTQDQSAVEKKTMEIEKLSGWINWLTEHINYRH